MFIYNLLSYTTIIVFHVFVLHSRNICIFLMHVAYVRYAYIKSIHSLVMSVTNSDAYECYIYLHRFKRLSGKRGSTTRKVIKVPTKVSKGRHRNIQYPWSRRTSSSPLYSRTVPTKVSLCINKIDIACFRMQASSAVT